MRNAKLYMLIGLLTLGNIGFRVARADSHPNPIKVSHLEEGHQVESAELDRLLETSALPADACRMVVAFNPDCPFCQNAADRERVTARAGAYGETLWITDEHRARLPDFVGRLPDGTRHAIAAEAFEALDVDAVPALFMIDRGGVLRWVGYYHGDETSEQLERRCAASAVPFGAAEATVTEP